MKNILLVTHGEFAKGIISSLNLVYGNVKNISTIIINSNENISEIKENIIREIENFNNDYPTVIITDIANGSTTQSSLECLNYKNNIYILTGLNLGLLLEVVLADISDNLEENKNILREIVENTRETINFVNDMIKEIEISENSDEL